MAVEVCWGCCSLASSPLASVYSSCSAPVRSALSSSSFSSSSAIGETAGCASVASSFSSCPFSSGIGTADGCGGGLASASTGDSGAFSSFLLRADGAGRFFAYGAEDSRAVLFRAERVTGIPHPVSSRRLHQVNCMLNCMVEKSAGTFPPCWL